MNERPIDRHESKRKWFSRNDEPERKKSHIARPLAVSKVNTWIDAWTACYEAVQEYTHLDLKQFHTVFEHWVPILNWIFEKPIFHLENYEPYFYYCNQQNGPKEIIQLYMEQNYKEGGTTVHVIFNIYEFDKLHKQFCEQISQSNQLLFNEARGTVNLSSLIDEDRNTAEYFRIMTGWQLLFIHTLHALAHWDIYDKYRHSHYDTHLYMKESPFYKFYCCGDMVIRK